MEENLSDDLSKHLVFVFLDFFSKNFDFLAGFDSLLNEYIHILDKNFENNYFGYLSNIDISKKFSKAASNNSIEKHTFSFHAKTNKRKYSILGKIS